MMMTVNLIAPQGWGDMSQHQLSDMLKVMVYVNNPCKFKTHMMYLRIISNVFTYRSCVIMANRTYLLFSSFLFYFILVISMLKHSEC